MIPLTDWLVLGAIGLIWLVLLFVPNLLQHWAYEHAEQIRLGMNLGPRGGYVFAALRGFVIGLIGVIPILLLYSPTMRLIDAISQLPRSTARTVLGTVFILMTAGTLVTVRVKYLRGYAVLEIMFGLAAAVQTMQSLQDTVSPVQLVGIVASVYLIIRGLDNFKKDVDARRERARVPQGVAGSTSP